MTAPYQAMINPVDNGQQVTRVELAALDDLRTYARQNGVYLQLHRCRLVPFHYGHLEFVRQTGVWGFAAKRDGWRYAVGGYCAGADKETLAIAVAHELGHCEQMGQADLFLGHKYSSDPAAYETCWHQEVDAWQRGLRILGDLGRPLHPRHADFIEQCLATYAVTAPEAAEADAEAADLVRTVRRTT